MTDQELAVFLTLYAGFWVGFIAIFYNTSQARKPTFSNVG